MRIAPTLNHAGLNLIKIEQAVDHAAGTALQINAGHGLHYHNVQAGCCDQGELPN